MAIRKLLGLTFLLTLGSASIFSTAASAETWGKFVDAGVGKTVAITSVTSTNHYWVHAVDGVTIGGENYPGGSQASVSHNWSGNVFASVYSSGSIMAHSARVYCPPGKACGLSTSVEPVVTH